MGGPVLASPLKRVVVELREAREKLWEAWAFLERERRRIMAERRALEEEALKRYGCFSYTTLRRKDGEMAERIRLLSRWERWLWRLARIVSDAAFHVGLSLDAVEGREE